MSGEGVRGEGREWGGYVCWEREGCVSGEEEGL